HFLKSNRDEPGENELIFVSGCPAITRRRMTVSDMQFLREQQQTYFRRQIGCIRILEEYRNAGGDHISASEVEYSQTIARKTFADVELLLLRPGSELMRRLETREDALRAAVNRDPDI